jgi:hypothetical protein
MRLFRPITSTTPAPVSRGTPAVDVGVVDTVPVSSAGAGARMEMRIR